MILELVAQFNSSGPAMDYFIDGDMWNMILAPYLAVIGTWFYVFLMVFLNMILMMRSQSIAVPAIFSVAAVACFYAMLPQEVLMMAAAVTILFLVVALLRFYTRGNP